MNRYFTYNLYNIYIVYIYVIFYILYRILYYSNYCDNCKKLLGVLSQNKVKEEVHYLCIDKRVKGNDGATYVILENSQKILLPPTVTIVPALLLITQGHHVLFGDQIYQHLQPRENNFSQRVAGAPN